jgi:hypothetical protein
MDISELQRVVKEVKPESDTVLLLKKVREVVYGDRGWDSLYRIDEFELNDTGLFLKVSDRSLGLVFTHVKHFTKRQHLRLVA